MSVNAQKMKTSTFSPVSIENQGEDGVKVEGIGKERLWGSPIRILDKVRLLLIFLKLFNDAPLQFSGSLKVTSNSIFVYFIWLKAI